MSSVTVHEVNGKKLYTQQWFNESLQRQQLTIASDELVDGSYFFVQSSYKWQNGLLQITPDALNSDKYSSVQKGSEKAFNEFLADVMALIEELNSGLATQRQSDFTQG